jgi:hypothetical protein
MCRSWGAGCLRALRYGWWWRRAHRPSTWCYPSASALGEGGEISDQELEAAAGGGGEERDPSCYKTACGW